MKFVVAVFLYLSMIAVGAQASEVRCELVLLESHSETSIKDKAINTVKAPLISMKEKLTYTQDPALFNFQTYKKLEQNLNPQVAASMRRLLFYTSNGLRKSYNFLAADGVGMPLLPIKTKQQIEAELRNAEGLPTDFQKTYWSDLKNMIDRIPMLNAANKGGKKALAAITFTSAAIFGVHTFGNVAVTAVAVPVTINAQVSVTKAMPLRADQIQILNEVTPMPHTAIRIGDNVFSHGVSVLTQKHIDYYMRTQQIQNGANASSAPSLAGIAKKRTVDAITLNLSPEIVAKIQAELMQETGKVYKNTTFVNSCASMIVRILKDQGVALQDTWLDASPSMMSSRLALESLTNRQNTQGAPLVDKIYAVGYENTPGGQDFLHKFLTRELEVGVHLNLRSLPYYAGQRIGLSAKNDTTQDLYIETAERKKILTQFQEQAAQDLRMSQAYYLYDLAKSSNQPKEVQEQFRSELAELLQQSENRVRDTNITFQDFHLEQLKIDLLREALRN